MASLRFAIALSIPVRIGDRRTRPDASLAISYLFSFPSSPPAPLICLILDTPEKAVFIGSRSRLCASLPARSSKLAPCPESQSAAPCAMAIHPSLRPQSEAQGSLSPQQTRAISAWTEQATASLENLTISETMPAARNDACAESTPTGGALRGATVSLSIPLDDPNPAADHQSAAKTRFLGQASNQTKQVPSVTFRRREPLRRDSLKRREALLKGKDGSRRRQRWENGMSCPSERAHGAMRRLLAWYHTSTGQVMS